MKEDGITYLNEYRYQGYREEDGYIVLETNGAPRIRIDWCQSDAVRIWAAPSGTLQKTPSFAVDSEKWEPAPYEIDDEPSCLTISTDRLQVRIHKNPLRIAFLTSQDEAWITGERFEGGIGWRADGSVTLRHQMSDEEHFYGLGQDNEAELGRLDRRGTTRDMATGQKLAPGTVTANIPVTFFMSTGNAAAGGYGMFFDNSWRSAFDMGQASDDYYEWRAEGGDIVYYFFYGPSLKRLIERYTRLTGRPSLPPLWSLGFIQSRCSYQNWDEFDDVIATMRVKQYPLDVMVFDYDWAEHMQNFRWHAKFEGKSPQKLADHGEDGIQFLISNSGPMIRKDSTNYDDGWKAGVFATDGNGHAVSCGHYGGDLLDFTAPAIKDWLRPQLRALFDAGVKGWWLDLTEPEGEPLQTVYQGGPRQLIRNVYSLLNTKTYYELQLEFDPASRPFILTRTGSAGIQKYGAAIWSGDVYSDYETLAAHVPEGLNAAMSGIAAWTSDTGGFISSTYDVSSGTHVHLYENDMASQALLYERWLQFSCFSPIMRAHHVGPAAPYEFGELAGAGSRHYLQLRYRLLPYIYSYVRETSLNGMPIMRALVLEYPNDPAVYSLQDQYLFGRELLVAPVLTEHTTAREVYFPEGEWIDYDYGHVYDGGSKYAVYAPQNRIPLFVKAGAIIPMAPPMSHSGEKRWDPVILDIYPNGLSAFNLYADDGNTSAYATDGAYTETHVECEQLGSAIRLDIRESNKQFAPRQYECRFHLSQTPTSAEHDGFPMAETGTLTALGTATEGWHWELASRLLTVKIAAGDRLHSRLLVSTDGKPLPRRTPPILDEGSFTGVRKKKRQSVGQGAYLLPSPTIPCKVQAENYDRGGQSVAYHMRTKGNAGDLYRWDDVNIEITSDAGGGYNVFGLTDGEWLSYTINVPEPGVYEADIRYAAESDGSAISLLLGGSASEEQLVLPGTGGRQSWATATLSGVVLERGEQAMKLIVMRGTLQLNFIELRKAMQ